VTYLLNFINVIIPVKLQRFKTCNMEQGGYLRVEDRQTTIMKLI
jgi:hypothetical protein